MALRFLAVSKLQGEFTKVLKRTPISKRREDPRNFSFVGAT